MRIQTIYPDNKVSALSLDLPNIPSSVFAASFSNKIVKIVDKHGLAEVSEYSLHRERITDLKFSNYTDSVLFSSSDDGLLAMMDIRSGKMVGNFQGTCALNRFHQNMNDHILSMAFSSNNVNEIILCDIRNWSAVQQYSDFHSDEITDLSFHPFDSSILLSSSVDGLICFTDCSKNDTDSSLQLVVNTKFSIQNFAFSFDAHSLIVHSDDRKMAIFASNGDLISEISDLKEIDENIDFSVGFISRDSQTLSCFGNHLGELFIFGPQSQSKLEVLRGFPDDVRKSGILYTACDDSSLVRCDF